MKQLVLASAPLVTLTRDAYLIAIDTLHTRSLISANLSERELIDEKIVILKILVDQSDDVLKNLDD